MSDFVYSKKPVNRGRLTHTIQTIYHQNKPDVIEFHGIWGSLAVSYNLYNGFKPLETNEHICIVLGGPVLCFQNNSFLAANNDNDVGTQAIYNRWLTGSNQWDEDLSGPFVVFIINKNTSDVFCITDLMSFIPVFVYQGGSNILFSTHVDILARISGQHNKFDKTSIVDFLLFGVVTYPYTAYMDIYQIAPASVHIITGDSDLLQSSAYWIPKEEFKYQSIGQAANDLNNGLHNYVNAVANEMPIIAQFLSGGEDSRAIAALLPSKCQRDAYIFLDNMNREGQVAKKAAQAYGLNFHVATRNNIHYLEILPACADLVGTGFQYVHVHTFGFHKTCHLEQYTAVFGGLFSDALLKGARITKIRGMGLFPFLPQIKWRTYSIERPIEKARRSGIFNEEVLNELTERRWAHLAYVKKFRRESAEEWFELWPSSMNLNIPNIHGNRRLFRSYEPFMSKEVVKLSAVVPQNWKLNRRLFQRAAKSLLKPTKWLLHSDGRFPYFPWYINGFVQLFFWVWRKLGYRIGLIKGNQGPWGEWNVVMGSQEWHKAIDEYSEGIRLIESEITDTNVKQLFINDQLNQDQLVNLMQLLYHLHKGERGT